MRLTRSTFPKEPFPIVFIMPKLLTVIFLVAGLLGFTVFEIDAGLAGFLRMRLISWNPLGTTFAPCIRNLVKSMLSKMSRLEYSNAAIVDHNHFSSPSHLQSNKQYAKVIMSVCDSKSKLSKSWSTVGTWIQHTRFADATAES